MAIDAAKLDAFMGRFVQDMGAVAHAATVLLGDALGLYKAMGDSAPVTPATLAERTGCDERYLREWLAAQAASGYVEYDPVKRTFRLPEEQAFTLTREDNAVFLPGGYQVARSMFLDLDVFAAAFRSGRGIGWHEHSHDLFAGTERFFRPTYVANLVGHWIPALDGIDAKLRSGAHVADVGCGFGASTIELARTYRRSRFVGFDYHTPSIETARLRAQEAGVSDNVRFEVAPAKTFPGGSYDLIAFFDCLHDMGDPVGAARHVREKLDPGGTWMIVEPFAHDELEKNLNPVGRIFYSASTCICTPASRAQEVGLALGAQAGETRMRELTREAGFTHFRRAAETPFNLVYEVRR